MGKARFLYDNLITDPGMITLSSLRPGIVTDAKKEGTGSATLVPSGSYSGTEDKRIIVEIDSIAGGAEIGQATFRWSDGSGTWLGSGITTSSVSVLLAEGIYVKWDAGTGDDFVLGDKWTFLAINLFGIGALIDLDRDHRCRTAALESPNTITINLSAVADPTFTALIIFDHNLTSAATIVLEADDAATFDSDGGNPQVSEAVTWAADKILHYLAASQTKDHARLKITDTANPDGYIEIGELYLGPYLELTKNFLEGYSRTLTIIYSGEPGKFGKHVKSFRNIQRKFAYNFGAVPGGDLISMEDLLDAITDRATGMYNPIYYNDNSALPGSTWLMDVFVLTENHETLDRFNMPLELTEVVATL